MTMKTGYARVSTDEQNLDLQLDALLVIEKEDILIVWKLDRLGRSLGFLCELIERLKGQGLVSKA